LIDPLAGDTENLGGLGVSADRLILESREVLEPLQDGVLARPAILILVPLAGRDFGNSGQFHGFVTTDEKAAFFIGPCVIRSYFLG